MDRHKMTAYTALAQHRKAKIQDGASIEDDSDTIFFPWSVVEENQGGGQQVVIKGKHVHLLYWQSSHTREQRM